MKHSLKEKYYIRYTDDFVIIHHDREHLQQIISTLKNFLEGTLHLELHPNKVNIRKYIQGIDFLGYVVLPEGIIVRTKTKRRILRKLGLRARQYKKGIISEKTFFQSVNSYFGVLTHADAYQFKSQLQNLLWLWVKESSSSPEK